MLQQKQQELPYIGVFKLNSGEEFIGKVTSETMMAYTVEKPRCLVPTERGLSFAPFMMLSDPAADVVIPKPVIYSKPSEALSAQYETSISGIALPKKSAIITS